jgi:hypothetical protein|tara:strand:- start:699 stop:935 length:237 start_codon:yes stop_codon:yes gene_type:complete
MNKITHDNICKVTCTDTDKVADAEVMHFQPKDFLTCMIATNKLHFKWTGRIFVANAQGLEFTTPGPREYTINTGRGGV